MIFNIGIYRMDVDTGKTSAYYGSGSEIGCDCQGCRNFEKAVQYFPEDLRDLLLHLGIHPGSPIEISALHAPDDKTVLYSGFYYICGTILEGTDPWIQVAKKQFRLNEAYKIALSKDFTAHFHQTDLLLGDFPKPVIQLDFSGSLPWLLSEPNPYT